MGAALKLISYYRPVPDSNVIRATHEIAASETNQLALELDQAKGAVWTV